MRELLYYQDVMMQQFTAQIVRTSKEETRSYVVLSNTAFYPTGGGQPHDTGMINDCRVVDVEKVDDEIRHYVEGNVDALEGEVTGRIDWERRFDHMQQHCGQHILTAAFVELFDFPTVSFHLGTELVTIDIAAGQVSDEQLAQAEKRANEIILENRPIETKWLSREELSSYPLRKDVAVEEDIRLVIIPEYDYNGCGGTHPTSTGQVSAIKIMGTEKMKSNTRISFVCGNRVLHQLAMRKAVLSDIARQLSVPEHSAAEALRKMFIDTKDTEKALEDAQNKLLEYEARELVEKSENGIVGATFENRTVQALQKLGRIVVSQMEDGVCLLVANNEDKLQFIAARGSRVEKSMKLISGAILPLINGKGGGSDAFVQGGGEKCVSAVELLGEMEKLAAK
ncbi:serine-tRNA(Ala) deacylase AlaX [Ureibacillus sinduriensis]|uniref:Alanyl-tRNA synthetase n=1 Tax=Ureibacillus sinduriensis BLB-1 = JCM 15800 TaxID=1384057 RepID=A0A0A3ITS7_9BACL|nr:serine-tRNA(Ala) deacylase AlaX [Ureibacillus sinduriensis]KGR78242.1 alanyl-tRNA synthetase [Ureibacillus sinduriensis BLB-1 = JCM 15800]